MRIRRRELLALGTVAGLVPWTTRAGETDDKVPVIRVVDARLAEARRELRRDPAVLAAERLPADLDAALARVQALRTAQPAAQLRGYSAEALPFCLRQLPGGAGLRSQRLGTDLFAWTLPPLTDHGNANA